MHNFEAFNIKITLNYKNVINNLSFNIKDSNIYIIKGANSSGKTSLIKAILGLINLSDGYFLYNKTKLSNQQHWNNFLSNIAYIGHNNGCIDNWTVIDNLLFWAKQKNTLELVLATIYHFGLTQYTNIEFFRLSAGIKRRVALSRLFIFNAKIWILDEPFTNLDNISCEKLIETLEIRRSQGGLILLTHHSQSYNAIIDNASVIEI